MAEMESQIIHRKSILWGLVQIQNKKVMVGHEDGFEDTWYASDGNGDIVGRFRYYKIRIASPNSIVVHDWKNVYCGRTDIELTGEQINRHHVSVPQSCVVSIVSGLVGYNDRYIYRAEGK